MPVALSCKVVPTVIVPDEGEMLIDVSTRCGAFTVMAEEAVWPPSLAVTVALPGATAVTIPALLTVATAALEVVHVAVAVTSPLERSL